PPASTYQLQRDLGRLFLGGDGTTVQTDPLTRLLVALQPGLKNKLYPSLANTETVRPSSLQRIEALRVTAAPFGAAAPLKPVYSGSPLAFQGSFTEWPLVGCIEFQAVLQPVTGASGFKWVLKVKDPSDGSLKDLSGQLNIPGTGEAIVQVSV